MPETNPLERILQLIQTAATTRAIVFLALLAFTVILFTLVEIFPAQEIASIFGLGKSAISTNSTNRPSTNNQSNYASLPAPQFTKEELDRYAIDPTIGHVQLTPITFDIPSSLYFEVRNDNDYPVISPTISVDLGRALLRNISIQANGTCKVGDQVVGKAFFTISCNSIQPRTSVYVYALITQSDFNEIVVNGPRISSPIIFTFSQVRNTGIDSWKWFWTLCKILSGILICVLFLFLLIIIVRFLNAVFKISW